MQCEGASEFSLKKNGGRRASECSEDEEREALLQYEGKASQDGGQGALRLTSAVLTDRPVCSVGPACCPHGYFGDLLHT